MDNSLERHRGKVAIVTGAGQGIGQGVALRLAQEGAHVVIAEYQAERAHIVAQECSAYTEALAFPIDIGDVDQIDRMVQAVVTHFGRIDILVNNAGVLETLPLFDVTPEKWDWLQRVNQRGLFFCLQRVAIQMVAQVPPEVKEQGRADRQLWENCQLFFGSRAQWPPLCRALFRCQVGSHQHYTERRELSCPLQYQRQCRMSGYRSDADVG